MSDLVLEDSYRCCLHIISLPTAPGIFLELSALFQMGNLRARTALLTLRLPGELIREKIDGVFISDLIAAATLTWRLQKHKKATAWNTCGCLGQSYPSPFPGISRLGCREAAYHSNLNQSTARRMTASHISQKSLEVVQIFRTFQRREEWRLAWLWISEREEKKT